MRMSPKQARPEDVGGLTRRESKSAVALAACSPCRTSLSSLSTTIATIWLRTVANRPISVQDNAVARTAMVDG